MHIINIVGARPNFMKIAPIVRAIEERKSQGIDIKQTLVHTGQHYSPEMSDILFTQLGLPEPDINLNIGSGSHGQQTGRIMEEFEKILFDIKPDVVLVVGDVNSTIACAIDAKKLGIKVVHVEAGLRSHDMDMPEEINRILTDSISDFLFTTEKSGTDNLIKEGHSSDKIHFVGNVMIDSLISNLEKADKTTILSELGLSEKNYVLATLHRPSNVDTAKQLEKLGSCLTELAKDKTIVFPAHPRTVANIESFGLGHLFSKTNNIIITKPLPYHEFICLIKNSHAVVTDSGGIQEETTYLGVPCLTLRENTERPVTITEGTNILIGTDPDRILEEYKRIDSSDNKQAPALWDGKAAKRIIDTLLSVQ